MKTSASTGNCVSPICYFHTEHTGNTEELYPCSRCAPCPLCENKSSLSITGVARFPYGQLRKPYLLLSHGAHGEYRGDGEPPALLFLRAIFWRAMPWRRLGKQRSSTAHPKPSPLCVPRVPCVRFPLDAETPQRPTPQRPHAFTTSKLTPYVFLCRSTSNISTAAATAAFNDSAPPGMGMCTGKGRNARRAASLTPSASPPMSKASGRRKSAWV